MHKMMNCLCLSVAQMFVTFWLFTTMLGYGNRTPPAEPPLLYTWAFDVLTFPTLWVVGLGQSSSGPHAGLDIATAFLLFAINSVIWGLTLIWVFSILRKKYRSRADLKAK